MRVLADALYPPLPLHLRKAAAEWTLLSSRYAMVSFGDGSFHGRARRKPASPGKFSQILRASCIVVGCMNRTGAGRAWQLARAHLLPTCVPLPENHEGSPCRLGLSGAMRNIKIESAVPMLLWERNYWDVSIRRK